MTSLILNTAIEKFTFLLLCFLSCTFIYVSTNIFNSILFCQTKSFSWHSFIVLEISSMKKNSKLYLASYGLETSQQKTKILNYFNLSYSKVHKVPFFCTFCSSTNLVFVMNSIGFIKVCRCFDLLNKICNYRYQEANHKLITENVF